MKSLPEVMAEFVELNKKVNNKRKPWTKKEMDAHVQRLNDWFASIQLDAMKEGMQRVAKLMLLKKLTSLENLKTLQEVIDELTIENL